MEDGASQVVRSGDVTAAGEDEPVAVAIQTHRGAFTIWSTFGRKADRFGPGRNLPSNAISNLDSSSTSARTGSNGSLVRPLSSPSLSLSSLAGSLPHVFPVPLRFVSPRHPQPPCSHLHPTPILPVFVTALRFQISCLLCIAFLFLPCCLYIRSVGRGRDGTRLSLSDGLCSRIFSSRARPKQLFGRTQRTYSQGRPFAR
jgi:hypothetical protein